MSRHTEKEERVSTAAETTVGEGPLTPTTTTGKLWGSGDDCNEQHGSSGGGDGEFPLRLVDFTSKDLSPLLSPVESTAPTGTVPPPTMSNSNHAPRGGGSIASFTSSSSATTPAVSYHGNDAASLLSPTNHSTYSIPSGLQSIYALAGGGRSSQGTGTSTSSTSGSGGSKTSGSSVSSTKLPALLSHRGSRDGGEGRVSGCVSLLHAALSGPDDDVDVVDDDDSNRTSTNMEADPSTAKVAATSGGGETIIAYHHHQTSPPHAPPPRERIGRQFHRSHKPVPLPHNETSDHSDEIGDVRHNANKKTNNNGGQTEQDNKSTNTESQQSRLTTNSSTIVPNQQRPRRPPSTTSNAHRQRRVVASTVRQEDGVSEVPSPSVSSFFYHFAVPTTTPSSRRFGERTQGHSLRRRSPTATSVSLEDRQALRDHLEKSRDFEEFDICE